MNKEIKKGTLIVEYENNKLFEICLILNSESKFLYTNKRKIGVHKSVSPSYFEDDELFTHKIYNK